MSERIERIKTQLNESRAYWESVLAQVGDRWETQVYSDGYQWTVRNIVVHVADSERGQLNQAQSIAEGRELIPPDFDVERYNRRVKDKHADVTIQEARTALDSSRADMFAWLDALDEEALDRQGRHASLQIMSVEQLLGVISHHERAHAADIAQALDITV